MAFVESKGWWGGNPQGKRATDFQRFVSAGEDPRNRAERLRRERLRKEAELRMISSGANSLYPPGTSGTSGTSGGPAGPAGPSGPSGPSGSSAPNASGGALDDLVSGPNQSRPDSPNPLLHLSQSLPAEELLGPASKKRRKPQDYNIFNDQFINDAIMNNSSGKYDPRMWANINAYGF